MPNPNGLPIWYELQALDVDAAKAFYEAVIDWQVAAPYSGEIDYRTLTTSGGGNVGGLMKLTDEMVAAGAKPGGNSISGSRMSMPPPPGSRKRAGPSSWGHGICPMWAAWRSSPIRKASSST